MSELIPIFPLPNVVLFPNVFLPLHIFEPRYRSMVADALAGDHLIGMVLLRPGWEEAYDGRPAVYAIGCTGVITHFDRLADGRYNIILRGLERFEVESEDYALSYRRAHVMTRAEQPLSADDRDTVHRHRSRLEALITPLMARNEADGGTSAMSDDDLVNALSQYLDFEPVEKQALLECPCLRSRAEAVIELLEMKQLLARTPGATRIAH